METFFQILLAGIIAFSVVYGAGTIAWRLNLLTPHTVKESQARHISQNESVSEIPPPENTETRSIRANGMSDTPTRLVNVRLNPPFGESLQETLKQTENANDKLKK